MKSSSLLNSTLQTWSKYEKNGLGRKKNEPSWVEGANDTFGRMFSLFCS